MMTTLSIENVRVRYGRREVIPGLGIAALQPGEVTALLGPNGCGKTTLLKAVAGLVRCDGKVVFDGQTFGYGDFAARARHIAYLPQTLPPTVHLRVFESILVARQATAVGLARGGDHAEVLQVLDRLAIGHLAMRYLSELSGGQRQLVGIAQALVRAPKVLLLDEPLSALDLNHQFQVMDLLRQETRARGMVTVIVLHDLNVALRHTDRALLLREGRLVAEGPPAAVINSATLAEVYGVRGRVEPCSQGFSQIMVDGLVGA
ncbi:hypothetical protein BJP62_17025 [Jeongeupia sp. USM3]|nr:hypothetical protein BJP62_17025 [Jeongeupia sp. USM3]